MDITDTYFRRPLHAPNISLSSPPGVALFTKALEHGTARSFFRLMEHQSHQQKPSYCGLSTIATALNALGVDPHRRWKGAWRYYDETLLECCVSLDHVDSAGVDFDTLKCIAKCNGLRVVGVRADETDVDRFRERVKQLCAREDVVVAVSYGRKVLNQTGEGHWSPLGAYEESSDSVLILDQARFKYGAHWTPLGDLFKAMLAVDPTTKKVRGYFELTVADVENGPPLAARALAFSLTVPFKQMGIELRENLPLRMKQVWESSNHDPEECARVAGEILGNLLSNRSCCEIAQQGGESASSHASNSNGCSPNGSDTSASALNTQLCAAKGGCIPPAENSCNKNGKRLRLAVLETPEMLACLLNTRMYKIVSDSAKYVPIFSPDDVAQIAWRATLVLCLDRQFWNETLGAKSTFFDEINQQDEFGLELYNEISIGRKQLRQLFSL